jgi:hypothetical protein
MRTLRVLLRIVLFLPALLLAGAGLCIIYAGTIAAEYKGAHGNEMPGNRQEMVEGLKAEGEERPFSFAVIGDAKGSETGEELLSMAASESKMRFVVNLGDVVGDPDVWQHRYFQTECREIARGGLPMFLVPGNHDVCYVPSWSDVPRERMVGPKEYDEMYGARKFSFVYSRCLFIISDFDGSDEPYTHYIEGALREKRQECEHAFVFLHVPPIALRGAPESRTTPEKDELFRILKEYNVDTVFFGDFHGYWRGKVNGVDVVVTGGGGSRLQGDTTYGFHHLVVISVDKDGASERIISIPTVNSLEDKFEELCFTRLFPVFGTSRVVYYAIGGVIFLAGAAVLFMMVRARLRKRRALRRPSASAHIEA